MLQKRAVLEGRHVFDSEDSKRSTPLLCWVTPRKEDEPRVKPGLVRLMAMTSSFIGTLSSRSSSAVYLPRHRTHVHRTLLMPKKSSIPAQDTSKYKPYQKTLVGNSYKTGMVHIVGRPGGGCHPLDRLGGGGLLGMHYP